MKKKLKSIYSIKKQSLWNKAKKNILGGGMLLSKRPEMFLPEYWPTYFSKAKNLNVWDLDNRKFIDMIYAVGQSTLGYTNETIDREVKKYISKGNMTTLNCPEEVELASNILKLHPWAHKTKFARSGGEANAIAIRIARSATNREDIAICGYHGWHDWYLSVNLKGRNFLKEHLLPGLNPKGVPTYIKNKVHTFTYGKLEELKKVHKKYNLGIVKMEVARNTLPDIKFLNQVRRFCTFNKIILIFDECTSGFRRNLGGLHMTTGVYPDVATFGKALGNGYAISAVIGKDKIMKKAEDSFISSTFWTERIGYVAANKTLDIMKKEKSYKKIIKNGQFINKVWKKLSEKHKIEIKIFGIESITSFNFSRDNLLYKTYLTQEMLKYGFLASNIIYVSTLHNQKVIKHYSRYLDLVFSKISYHWHSKKKNKRKLIKGSISHNTFKRLN